MHEEILIVDDKVQFSRSLGENLQDLGYRFRSATCTRCPSDARVVPTRDPVVPAVR